LFTGKAIIVFETMKDAAHILVANKVTLFTKTMRALRNKLCCCCPVDSLNHVIFERAPEPTDIIWEHLDITDFRKFKNTFITYFFSFILVAACFGIIYGLTEAKIKYTESTKDVKSLTVKIATNVIGAIISLVIVIINQSLRLVVRKASLYEECSTNTSQNLSVSLKLTLIRFVNTAIVPLAVNS
jgi:hypothetical protein